MNTEEFFEDLNKMNPNEWGSLTIRQPGYICPVHGDIGCDTMTSHMKGFEKVLCMRCYVEKLVEIGVCEVTEKQP
jgi:hypothetical protein